jgi:hypothetical protein
MNGRPKVKFQGAELKLGNHILKQDVLQNSVLGRTKNFAFSVAQSINLGLALRQAEHCSNVTTSVRSIPLELGSVLPTLYSHVTECWGHSVERHDLTWRTATFV